MRTFVASLIVLLFCLPSVSQAATTDHAENESADEIILKGKILRDGYHEGTFHFVVKYEGQLWWCSVGHGLRDCYKDRD